MQRLLILALLATASAAHAEQVGEVDTVFKLMGPTTRSSLTPMTTPA